MRAAVLSGLAFLTTLGLACGRSPEGGPPTDGTGGGGPGTGGAGPPATGGTGGQPGSGGAIDATGGAEGPGSGGASFATGGAAATGGGGGSDTVTRTSSTYSFQHYPIEVDAGGIWNGPDVPGTVPVTTTYDTVVLENGYLRVALLPAYGGRILSIVHKPTGTELLYQNPIGTPYLMQDDIFYYDYLVIMGGIFPSFPEPEHGRYWNQPYELEVVSDTPEAVTVRMSRTDDLDVAPGVPSQYDVGRTGLVVDLEVTLRAGRSDLELETTLTNPEATPIVGFEYWTVTTLAPGSMPGDTKIRAATRILADMDQVHLLESSWEWFGTAEERVSGEVFLWDNLSHFENWEDQGTAFANPEYTANWSGLVNYENDHGIVRVSNGGETPGLKLWTFGPQSLTADISDSAEWLRPTIEMWHGVTPEFWQRGALAGGAVQTWKDSYFPTFELREITAASDSGAVYLSRSDTGADTVLSALATLTVPGQTVQVVSKLDGVAIGEEDVTVPSAAALGVEATVPSSSIAPGAVYSVDFLLGAATLLSAQIVLE